MLKSWKIVSLIGCLNFLSAAPPLVAQTTSQPKPSNPSDTAVQHYPITDGKTLSGIRLVHFQLREEKDQSFQIFWPDREIQHSPEKAGSLILAPALMVLGGAGDLEGGAVEEELNDLGGSIRMSRGRSNAFAEVFAPRSEITSVMALFSTILQEPKLSQTVLTRRIRFLANNVQASREKPENFAGELLNRIIVGDHPIAKTITYDPLTTIKDITVSDINAWRKSVLRRGAMTVIASGPMTREDATAVIEKTFAGMPDGASEKAAVPFTPQSLHKTIVIERKVEQSQILMGGPVRWQSGGPEGISRNIAMSVLGASSNSRLFVAVREKLGAAYGSSASISSVLGADNIFSIQASVAHDKLPQALAAMQAEYLKFKEAGVTAAELDPLKRRIANGFPESMRKAYSAAAVIRTNLINELNFDAPNSLQRWVGEQSVEQINALIRERLPEKLTVILVVPSAKGIDADCVIEDMADLPACLSR